MNFFERKLSEHQNRQNPVQDEQSENMEIHVGSEMNMLKIFSPTTGIIIPLQQVNDEVFKNNIVGKGIGILPELPAIYSPVNGIVKYLPKTKHAVVVQSEDGVQVLIHIGIDTVNLKGQFFKSVVQVNDKVQVGEELIQFDLKEIENLGYSTVIPVVITNTNEYSRVEVTRAERIVVSDYLLSVIK